jgi:hypothetical protein
LQNSDSEILILSRVDARAIFSTFSKTRNNSPIVRPTFRFSLAQSQLETLLEGKKGEKELPVPEGNPHSRATLPVPPDLLSV